MKGCKFGNALTRERPASRISSRSVQPAIAARIAAFLHPCFLFILPPAIFLYKSAGSVVYLVIVTTVNCGRNNGWCERLYRAKAAELILYGRALGLSHNEAEDVVQETFMALLRLEEAPERPEHYCVRAFRNRTLNYRRSLWRRLTRELESRTWFENDWAETPAERAAISSLAELPPEQREVIVLKIWHEMTFQEIGALLEISPSTAAGRYRYGLQKLKARMKGPSYEQHHRFGDAIALIEATTPLERA